MEKFKLLLKDNPTPTEEVDRFFSLLASSASGGVKGTAQRIRMFKRLYSRRLDGPELTKLEGKILDLFGEELFPWLTSSKRKAGAQRGIVITVGQKYCPHAVHAINTLRLHDCKLPIEVFYSKDVSAKYIRYFNYMEGVKTVEINTILDTDSLHNLNGDDVKPFAMLASSFTEVILMDPDTIFMQNPEVMFDYPEYISTGAIFFIDRLFSPKKEKLSEWFHKILPEPLSEKLRTTEMYKSNSQHQQASGVVLIDKSRRLMGLLATCRLNCPSESKEMQLQTFTKTHKEKETYWLGFEVSEDPYEFIDSKVGSIGPAKIEGDGQIKLCGELAHFDRNNAFLWTYDGIILDLHETNPPTLNSTYIATVGDWGAKCLNTPSLRALSEDERILMEEIQKLWNPDPIKSFD
jgi:hypothetical protein